MGSVAGRIAGAGLAIAAVVITVLAALLYGDMSRETDLSREIQAIQEVRNGLDSLKDALHRLRFAAFARSRAGECRACPGGRAGTRRDRSGTRVPACEGIGASGPGGVRSRRSSRPCAATSTR